MAARADRRKSRTGLSLWRFVSETKTTIFGAGAAYFANCTKAGIDLARVGDLSRLRTLGSTGSPLSADTQQWFNERFARLAATNGNSEQADMFWANMSGGTDFAGAFIGANRELPQTPGLMQCRLLGAAVEAFDERGRPVIEEVGELVCTEPLPSMPLRFWNDEGDARYRASYFETYPDNYDGTGRGAVWRHGDWLKINTDGSCVIYGRSDATINRHGLRMGTSEIYSAIEALPEVLDSMVVDLEYLGRESYMPLFVVLREGVALDAPIKTRINQAIEAGLSRRFLPSEIIAVPEIPRTLSGKKQELPIKKLLLGHAIETVINRDAMANPGCLDWYLEFARDTIQGAGKIRHGLRRSFSANPERYDEVTGSGSSAYLCANHDDSVAGTHPTSPYRMNCTMPVSGPREPYSNSAAMKPSTPMISMRTAGPIFLTCIRMSSTAPSISAGTMPNR